MDQITKWGAYLHEARKANTEVDYIKKQFEELSEEQAYLIQDQGLEARLAEGEKFIAFKMGLTSEAKRKQMNLHSAIYGVLTDKMQVPHEGTYSLASAIHPKIEPEVAFYVAEEVSSSLSVEQLRAKVTKVAPALEILDSRFKSFKYFSLEDVIADNASSSHFILGPALDWSEDLNVSDLAMKMQAGGVTVGEGTSKAISGDPFQSVVQQMELLLKRGKNIPAGTWVLAGAATPAFALTEPCQVSLEVEKLGTVLVNIE